MPEKPQQQTLSVRISEALRRRLERARQLAVSKTGETVSTSEIAKQLLESARDDRLEIVDLLSQPTESLRQIRRKGESGIVLSRAEWAVVAHFVRVAIESASVQLVNPLSKASILAVLDAFLAAYALRTEPNARLDAYYLANLPDEDRPAPARRGQRTALDDQDGVRRTVGETRRREAERTGAPQAGFAGRNLYALLEEDRLAGATDLHKALRPFWLPLWRLAARGHYAEVGKPIRPDEEAREGLYQPPMPPITEGAYSLNCFWLGGQEFSVLVNFPAIRGVHMPISEFPRLNEFRSMVATMTTGPGARWSGPYFLGGASLPAEGSPHQLWFRAHNNGITFYFSPDEWAVLQRLFRRAWELPDIRQAWDSLVLDYGEL